MKLGIFIISMAGGGAERVVSYLLAHCVQNNIDTHLILMNSSIKYDIPKEIKIHYLENFDIEENGFLTAVKIPLLAYRYNSLAKKLKISHSVSFLTRPSLINVLTQKIFNQNYKSIINERSFPSLQYGKNDFRSVFNKFMIRKLFKSADLVISNSMESSRDLVFNFNVPENKTKVIYNPIDLQFIENFYPIKDFFCAENFNMVSVGRLNEGKNHEMLIRAVKKLNKPSVKLYILGQGSLRTYLQNLISELDMEGQVYLLGFLNNPYDYLKAADLFIFGSNFEGFPNVLLEAMACGLPILSTNCKSGPSEIMDLREEKDDVMFTDYGILVPTNNTDLMAKGITYLIENKKFLKKCSLNVRRRIHDFDKNTILKRYLEVIEST